MAVPESTNCPDCGAAAPASAALCPRCGAAIAEGVPLSEAPAAGRRFQHSIWLAVGAVTLVGMVVAAVLVATGGGDPPSGKPAGGAVTSSGLLAAGDLPGSHWQARPDASLTKAGGLAGFPSSSAPPSEECVLLRQFESELARLDASFSEGVSRAFEREGSGGAGTATVTQTLLVFTEGVDLRPVLAGLGAAFSGSDFGHCLEQSAQAAGLDATVSPTSPLAAVPEGGAATALRLAARASSNEAILSLQMFYWSSGRTLAMISVLGPEGDVTRELVGATVAAAQRAFERRSP